MRRFLGALAVSLILSGAWLPLPPARAQDQPSVQMRLVAQSVWNGPRVPLRLTFEATNGGDASLDDLSVVLSIEVPARSRSEYSLSLREDTTLLSASLFSQKGSLLPGQTRTFSLRQSLDALTLRGESVLYPLKVQLLSRDVPVGALRTPMLFLVERPQVPLDLQWTWVFAAPLQYRPDGVFLRGALESDVMEGGRLESMAGALEALGPKAADVVMSSVLADELERMKRGYRILGEGDSVRTVAKGTGPAAAAEQLLDTLSRIAGRPTTELLAYPLGDPSLPALVGSGIGKDLPVLLHRGEALTTSSLGVTPRRDVVRPPYSQLDVATTNRLRTLGARTLLIDADYLVPSPTPAKFTPAPVVQLVGGRKPMAAVIPDALVMARASAYPGDPTLAAHVALGELATIWLEFPGTPNRGASLLFGEAATLDPRFLPALSSLVGRSPWLRPVTARELVAVTLDREQRPIPNRAYPHFSPDYLSHLLFARAAVTQFGQTAEGAKPLVDRLQTQLLLADGGGFVSDPFRGRLFIDSAYEVVQQTYKRVVVSPGLVTLTSRQGNILVTLRNSTDYTIRVRIVLIADRRISFVKGESRKITLPPLQRTLTFAVRAETTGRFPVKVRIQTPGDPGIPQTITETEVLVRSTAYNRIALVLTIGAALFLLGWWGRRFLPRRRS
jgi:Family of unknown function (DUF6049)